MASATSIVTFFAEAFVGRRGLVDGVGAMSLAHIAAALALAGCASAPAPIEPAHDAPHPSSACALLQVARQGSPEMRLPGALQQRLASIRTVQLPRPVYQCGDANYQTDPNQLGFTFLAMGFTSDRRFAALKLQSVAAPLAGAGYTCLYQSEDEGWTLRGCQLDWIT